MKDGEKKYWLDDPRNVTKVYYGVWTICGIAALADLFYDKHGHFGFESWPGFHGWFGFIVFSLAVLTGKQLRKFLMRDEDYYDVDE